ncbi:C40 family peptidase [Jatrophihabitans fulvus]
MSPTSHTDRTDLVSEPAPATRRTRRLTAGLAAVSLAVTTAAAVALTVGAPAAGAAPADTSGAHDPIGNVGTITATSNRTGLTVKGWAADPDKLSSAVTVQAVLDGTTSLASTRTSLPWPAAVKKYRTNATPGYSLGFRVPTGSHTVCIVIENIGPGTRNVDKCFATPLGRAMSSSEVAAHSPVGALAAAATSSSVRVRGWTSDPDLKNRRSLVVLYLDGSPAITVNTVAYPQPRPTAAGWLSKFDVSVPVATGTHIACVWVVNSGFGSNTNLGCKAVDTRSPDNRTPAQTAAPAINAKVVTLAKKQIGKPYVWGATGPKSFDCSGLVLWAYGKYGRTTPRVSQDQIRAARLIPASHARPGDLVFYHDSVGDVYHVGIYLKPGLSVAAIDTNSGVNYQNIWDPNATYGSFTHT